MNVFISRLAARLLAVSTVAVALVSGFSDVAMPSAAAQQSRVQQDSGIQPGGDREREREDFRRGYRDGFKDGYEDGRHREPNSVVRDFNEGNSAYERGYRQGYQDGYDRGKRKSERHPN